MALDFALVRFLPGVPTHLEDSFLVWWLEAAVAWAGKGHGPEDKYSYRLKAERCSSFGVS